MSTSSGHGDEEGSFIFEVFIFTRVGIEGGANSDRMRPGADCLLSFFFGLERIAGLHSANRDPVEPSNSGILREVSIGRWAFLVCGMREMSRTSGFPCVRDGGCGIARCR